VPLVRAGPASGGPPGPGLRVLVVHLGGAAAVLDELVQAALLDVPAAFGAVAAAPFLPAADHGLASSRASFMKASIRSIMARRSTASAGGHHLEHGGLQVGVPPQADHAGEDVLQGEQELHVVLHLVD